MVVELVGVLVCPLTVGGGLFPVVSGFHENGGGGVPLSGFSTFVHVVTERVTEFPGWTVLPEGFKEIDPGVQAGGAGRIPKCTLVLDGPTVIEREVAVVAT